MGDVSTTSLVPEMRCEISFDLNGGETVEEMNRVYEQINNALSPTMKGSVTTACQSGRGISGDGLNCGKSMCNHMSFCW